jgi:hypothetical protein
MSSTPAAQLALLRITYSAWRIEQAADLLVARECYGSRVLRSTSAAGLENQLQRIDYLVHDGSEP